MARSVGSIDVGVGKVCGLGLDWNVDWIGVGSEGATTGW